MRCYNALIFVENKGSTPELLAKILKQAHNWLRNYFSNATIGKNSAVKIRSRGRAINKFSSPELLDKLTLLRRIFFRLQLTQPSISN